MKLILYSIILSSLLIGSCKFPTESKRKRAQNDSIVKSLVANNQILLTNSAEFKEHTALYGASSFLVKYKNTNYALTAKHLIGENGGVEPELNPKEVNDFMISWDMFPRVPVNELTDTISISNEEVNRDNFDKDILILPLKKRESNILILEPCFDLPKQGDKLYVIGCPYSEPDCKQNIYEVKYDSYDNKLSGLICIMKNKLEIAGFSGAPLVNSDGNVVGVVTSGGEQDGIFFIIATSVKEIEKIK